MDLYIFCVVLGAAGMAAMALLGFASSHSGGHGHNTSGHEAHGIGAPHPHSIAPPHSAHAPVHTIEYVGGKPHTVAHVPVAQGHGHMTVELHGSTSWRTHAWSWLSPRVMFNFLVGFGATGLVIERLVGPLLALPVAIVGGVAICTEWAYKGFEHLTNKIDRAKGNGRGIAGNGLLNGHLGKEG